MKVFWTSVFWIVIVLVVVLYIRSFDDVLGTKVAGWIAPYAVSSSVGTGVQDPVMTQLTTVQTDLDTMMEKVDMIANKLGITVLVVSGDLVDVTTGTILPVETK